MKHYGPRKYQEIPKDRIAQFRWGWTSEKIATKTPYRMVWNTDSIKTKPWWRRKILPGRGMRGVGEFLVVGLVVLMLCWTLHKGIMGLFWFREYLN